MELRVSDDVKTIRGDFCVRSISHCHPKTVVKVSMDDEVYECNVPNVKRYVVNDVDNPDIGFFDSGVFCKEITVNAPDAHVIVNYKDMNDGCDS